MNNEAEAIQHFVVWLLQTLDPANCTPSGDWHQAKKPEQTGSDLHSAEPLSSADQAGTSNHAVPDDLTDRSGQIAASQNESMPLDEPSSPLAFGDIPAVQQRFHALLKHRLKTEIERNPPRFPWETDQSDYQADYQNDYELQAVPSQSDRAPVPVWAAQFRTLNLPIALPESILQTLFDQCRDLVQSSLREGQRLVQAVESLFPDEKTALNSLAGLVLTSPARSGRLPAKPNLPIDYDQASRPQQMVLSLLAARQLFEAMTLTLLPHSVLRRSWLTHAGAITLEAQYSSETSKVQIDVQLPTGGTVKLQQAELEAIATCPQASDLSLSLSPIAVDQPATLTVELAGADVPLVFAVRLPFEFC